MLHTSAFASFLAFRVPQFVEHGRELKDIAVRREELGLLRGQSIKQRSHLGQQHEQVCQTKAGLRGVVETSRVEPIEDVDLGLVVCGDSVQENLYEVALVQGAVGSSFAGDVVCRAVGFRWRGLGSVGGLRRGGGEV